MCLSMYPLYGTRLGISCIEHGSKSFSIQGQWGRTLIGIAKGGTIHDQNYFMVHILYTMCRCTHIYSTGVVYTLQVLIQIQFSSRFS